MIGQINKNVCFTTLVSMHHQYLKPESVPKHPSSPSHAPSLLSSTLPLMTPTMHANLHFKNACNAMGKHHSFTPLMTGGEMKRTE